MIHYLRLIAEELKRLKLSTNNSKDQFSQADLLMEKYSQDKHRIIIKLNYSNKDILGKIENFQKIR